MRKKLRESDHPSFDYRTDGSWRISPPELHAEFVAYLAAVGYKPNSLTAQRLKELVNAFMIEREFCKTSETEQIVRDPK